MVDSPNSSLSTPVPLRAPPSPSDSDFSIHNDSPPFTQHRSPALSNYSSPSASAASLSPGSSSVSFTLAPVSPSISSLSLSPFTVVTPAIVSRPIDSNHTPSIPPYSHSTTLSTQAIQARELDDIESDEPSTTPPFSDAVHAAHTETLLRTLGLPSPNSSISSGLEPGEIPEDSLSMPAPLAPAAPIHSRNISSHTSHRLHRHSVDRDAAIPSSPEVLPSAPTRAYVPLPEIEIHAASFRRDPTPSPSEKCGSSLLAAPTSASTPRASPIHNGLGEYDNTPGTSTSVDDAGPKTPNVYINGLPPHYPEDQLFELASPFGAIRSVRSFTRHIGERESGYGFVLFETIDAAEKCIQSLRRFRNLHPTFSKQVHKIPGTPYANIASEHDGSSVSSAGDWDQESQTFKTKMERLHDPNSTNLYIEGLPLSIDDSSLSALVSPHRIKSSRFFQTRLSNPPRIIAFVRLETRIGAEEVIERLHGRMVRGWNDPGSRISVRFADTAEQRELRRTERTTQEGDQSPARLTIAQAALLNLHGRDQLASPSRDSSPLASLPSSSSIQTAVSRDDLSSYSSSGSVGLGSGHRNLAPNDPCQPMSHSGIRGNESRGWNAALSPYIAPPERNLALSAVTLPVSSQQQTFSMSNLLDSLRNGGIPFEAAGAGHDGNDMYQSNRMRQPGDRHNQILGDLNLNISYPDQPSPIAVQGIPVSGAVQARGGYTPTEEYILRAHAAQAAGSLCQQRRRPNRLDLAQAQVQAVAAAQARSSDSESVDYNLGVRAYRTPASMVAFNQHPQQHASSWNGSPVNPIQALPPLDGDGIAAFSGGGRMRSGSNARRSQSSEHDGESRPLQTQIRNYSGQYQNSHTRSSTLPQQNSSTAIPPNSIQHQQTRHYQHNSMNAPKARNISADILRHNHAQYAPKHKYTTSTSSITNENTTMNYNNHGRMYPTNATSQMNSNAGVFRPRGVTKDGHNHYEAPHFQSAYPDPEVYQVDQSSPELVSPALTYSSRGSGATMSPATPFLPSFSQETNEY